MTIAQLLVTFRLSEDDFARELAADLQATPDATAAGLSAADEAVLLRHGGIVRETPNGRADGRATLRAFSSNIAEQTKSSLSVQDAAQRLGVDASRIRHRVRDRALYGFKIGSGLRLPLWQFDDRVHTPIPGLRAVLTALPADLHPLEVAGFMTTPDSGLTIGDDVVTPRDWLLDGGTVAAIRTVADDLDRW